MSLVKIRRAFVNIGLITGISFEDEWNEQADCWYFKFYIYMKSSERILFEEIKAYKYSDALEILKEVTDLLEEHNIKIIH